MTDKKKLHQILSSLWKNDDSVGKTYYNQALQDVQTAIDLQEEPASEKKCMFTKDNYTDEDRKVLCEDCKEKCEYSKKEEHVSEDLEEAAEKYSNTDYNYFDVLVTEYDGTQHLMDDKVFIKDAFKDGAKWQKEQIMAKAIDGVITIDYYGEDDKEYGCVAHDSFCLKDFGLNELDKVKVIVIKED